jgi:hypothetical protein
VNALLRELAILSDDLNAAQASLSRVQHAARAYLSSPQEPPVGCGICGQQHNRPPIFSCERSERLWQLINSTPAEAGDALYLLGCKLQELESRIERLAATNTQEAATPSGITNGPSQEGADGSAATHTQEQPVAREPTDEGCICVGNWRDIVKEYEPLIGREFNGDGKRWTFFGIVHADDDYYFGMSSYDDHTLRLLSCIGTIPGHGYELIDAAPKHPSGDREEG